MTSAPPAPKSEAHRRIAQLVAEHGIVWVEKTKLKLGENAVRAWLREGRSPQKRIRERVATVLDIAVELWDLPAGAEDPHLVRTSTQRASSDVEKPDTAPAAPPSPPATPPPDASDARANVEATLRILRMRLEGLSPEKIDALAKVCNAITASSRLLARLSGQLDVTEAQILRSDAWKKLVRLVRDVLEAFPDAAKALDKAIAEYEAGA